EAAAEQDFFDSALYGIAERREFDSERTKLVANPGWFPTSLVLAVRPLISQYVMDVYSIISASKTGASGAGRALAQHLHYAEMNENFSAYAIGNHKHKPEIEQYVSNIAGTKCDVMFTPHLIPMTRGILSTLYVKLNKYMTAEHLHDIYKNNYEQKPFIRIRDLGEYPKTKEVYGSNF